MSFLPSKLSELYGGLDMDALETALEQLLPRTLDDIIRANRDTAQLYFSTDYELNPLRGTVEFGPVTARVSNWAFITLHLKESQVGFVYLVGFNQEERCSWMTSFVTGIDKGKVTTKSGSLYELVGDSTLDVDLPYICATLHLWGLGPKLGVPHFFF